jgi:DNA phosphorothioation-dependent restriction protein DptF
MTTNIVYIVSFDNKAQEMHEVYKKQDLDQLYDICISFVQNALLIIVGEFINESNLTFRLSNLSKDERFSKELRASFEVLKRQFGYGRNVDIQKLTVLYATCSDIETYARIHYLYRSMTNESITNVSTGQSVNSVISKSSTAVINKNYLLYELDKLSESSNFVIANEKSYNELQDYLHITRIFETRLIETIEKSYRTDKSKLILLCGNVGDGKSHLLSYIKEKYKELVPNYNFINDATESIGPDKNAMQTLRQKLGFYNDSLLDVSKKKTILAINLGILKNFIEYDNVRESFSRFAGFIDDVKAFDLNSNDYVDSGYFTLINISSYGFIDYSDGVNSVYIDQFLEKITKKDVSNPFYNAYLKDKKIEPNSSVIVNYEMLSFKFVRDKIKELIIRVIIETDYILSMRALMNFVQFLLAGPKNSNNSYSLLPNLLFDSAQESELLKRMANLDPVSIKSEEIDKLLIRLALEKDYHICVENYTQFDQGFLLNLIKNIDLKQSYLLQKTLVRTIFLSPKSQGNGNHILDDYDYSNYLSYLADFNNGRIRQKDIYDLVEYTIKHWNGFYGKSDLVYLTQNTSGIKFLEKIKLEKKVFKDQITNTRQIYVKYVIQAKEVILEVDYNLYFLMVKMKKGYVPNRFDKESAYRFNRFIQQVYESGDKSHEIFFHNVQEGKLMCLTYDEEFESFTFIEEALA